MVAPTKKHIANVVGVGVLDDPHGDSNVSYKNKKSISKELDFLPLEIHIVEFLIKWVTHWENAVFQFAL